MAMAMATMTMTSKGGRYTEFDHNSKAASEGLEIVIKGFIIYRNLPPPPPSPLQPTLLILCLYPRYDSEPLYNFPIPLTQSRDKNER